MQFLINHREVYPEVDGHAEETLARCDPGRCFH
jgi:hypothetical protein